MTVLTTKEQLNQLKLWIAQNTPFLYTRYNDGEINGMFNLVPTTATTSGEHHHFRDLGKAMLVSFTELSESYLKGTTKNLLIGSYWHENRNQEISKVFIDYLTPRGWDCSLPWSNSDLWYNTGLEVANTTLGNDLIELIDEVRSTASSKPIVLVSNQTVSKARFAFGAESLQIPSIDAWLQSNNTLQQCYKYAKDNATFIWCSGLPGKVWMWDTYKKYPNTSHIDAGHSFDLAFNVRSRAWHHRKDGAHYQFVQSTLIPYLRKFYV